MGQSRRRKKKSQKTASTASVPPTSDSGKKVAINIYFGNIDFLEGSSKLGARYVCFCVHDRFEEFCVPLLFMPFITAGRCSKWPAHVDHGVQMVLMVLTVEIAPQMDRSSMSLNGLRKSRLLNGSKLAVIKTIRRKCGLVLHYPNPSVKSCTRMQLRLFCFHAHATDVP